MKVEEYLVNQLVEKAKEVEQLKEELSKHELFHNGMLNLLDVIQKNASFSEYDSGEEKNLRGVVISITEKYNQKEYDLIKSLFELEEIKESK